MQLLWDITDTQTSLALKAAFIGADRANSQFCGGAFTSAIWANDGDNFAFANAQINAPHKPAIVTPDTSILKID